MKIDCVNKMLPTIVENEPTVLFSRKSEEIEKKVIIAMKNFLYYILIAWQ